ncbi:MAG: hypothetical protein L6V95_00175 [Candidatus Melainabacteria bacterium]|nr:MAG: hypothetical protein L6V95_00175 [Candidatus Melainabacteria bacterium]
MLNNIANILSKAFAPSNQVAQINQASAIQKQNQVTFGGDHGRNPFIQNITNNSYGKNNPSKSGYFAGYYNGQPNIVGKRIFIEA